MGIYHAMDVPGMGVRSMSCPRVSTEQIIEMILSNVC